jgi:hypothetical protein
MSSAATPALFELCHDLGVRDARLAASTVHFDTFAVLQSQKGRVSPFRRSERGAHRIDGRLTR